MATHDDDHVVRLRPKSGLLPKSSLLPPGGKAAGQPLPDATEDDGAASPAMDGLIPLPGPGDPYKAHARPDNKALLTLTFLCQNSAEEGFAYADLRRIRLLPADKPGGGPVLVLLFTEAAVTEVRIVGRRLDTMRDYIRYHRVAWLRELPPGKMLADRNAAVITGITINQVES
jgi:hypothetical protein